MYNAFHAIETYTHKLYKHMLLLHKNNATCICYYYQVTQCKPQVRAQSS